MLSTPPPQLEDPDLAGLAFVSTGRRWRAPLKEHGERIKIPPTLRGSLEPRLREQRRRFGEACPLAELRDQRRRGALRRVRTVRSQENLGRRQRRRERRTKRAPENPIDRKVEDLAPGERLFARAPKAQATQGRRDLK